MTFAEKSKYLRAEKNLSQVELANALKVSKACISMLEIGKNEPTANTLIRYADFFECSIDFLLCREDDFGNITINCENLSSMLSNEESALLEDFRSLPRQEKAQAAEYVHYLASKRGNKSKHA